VRRRQRRERTSESCGDGTLDPGEECDDGNTLRNDECSGLCRNEGIR
jgi:large repetitive protein